jgi:hypothetical protein
MRALLKTARSRSSSTTPARMPTPRSRRCASRSGGT